MQLVLWWQRLASKNPKVTSDFYGNYVVLIILDAIHCMKMPEMGTVFEALMPHVLKKIHAMEETDSIAI